MSERDEYTPSMNDLRTDYMSEYCFHGQWEDDPEKGRTFDRAIAAHDREVRREYGEQVSDLIQRISIAPYLAPRAIGLLETMRERAASIARGEDQTDE